MHFLDCYEHVRVDKTLCNKICKSSRSFAYFDVKKYFSTVTVFPFCMTETINKFKLFSMQLYNCNVEHKFSAENLFPGIDVIISRRCKDTCIYKHIIIFAKRRFAQVVNDGKCPNDILCYL